MAQRIRTRHYRLHPNDNVTYPLGLAHYHSRKCSNTTQICLSPIGLMYVPHRKHLGPLPTLLAPRPGQTTHTPYFRQSLTITEANPIASSFRENFPRTQYPSTSTFHHLPYTTFTQFCPRQCMPLSLSLFPES